MTREEAIEVFRTLDQQGLAVSLSSGGGDDYQVEIRVEGLSGDQVTAAIAAIKQTLSFAEDASIQFDSRFLVVR